MQRLAQAVGKKENDSTSPEGAQNMFLTTANIHFIFGTYHRTPSIQPDMESALHACLAGIIHELGGESLCINGMPDHVHLLVRMPGTQPIAGVARLIKTNSSQWVRDRWPRHKAFAWQPGYGAFRVSESNLQAICDYIANQRLHHASESFQQELEAFLTSNHIVLDERYL